MGLAVDAKPWALIFLPILLLAGTHPADPGAPGVARPRALALAAGSAAAVIAAGWLPFFIAEPGTMTAARYTIENLPDSASRALGVTTPKTPSGDRIAQVATGCAVGVLAIWRGRWPAVILLAVGARIALDPAAHSYYTAGVMLGALNWDMIGVRRPVPLWSALTFGALTVVPLLTSDPHRQGTFRLALVVAFTLDSPGGSGPLVLDISGPAREVRPGRPDQVRSPPARDEREYSG